MECGRCQCIGYASCDLLICIHVIFLSRSFGRSCECILPEGADPNAQGNGYDQCPLVTQLLWLPFYKLTCMMY